MEGFTFNGIHSSKLGCFYIPDASGRWFASPEFETYDEEVFGRDGGYRYGTRTRIRTISLKMYFEDITIETRERIRQWLDRKVCGDLVFDDRPFVTYRNVCPAKTVQGQMYTEHLQGMPQDTYSGTFTVDFKLYEPFGYLNYNYYTGYDTESSALYSGMLEEMEMPAAPTTASRAFLMYNPGTEVCDTVITLAGTAANG